MLRPEHHHSESLDRLPAHLDRSAILPGKQSHVLPKSAAMHTLMESLIPQGISPAKQAVIERLIEMWVAKSERDVA